MSELDKILELYAKGKLEVAKLVDVYNRNYDIAVLMARKPKSLDDEDYWEYVFIEYIYGGDSYDDEKEAIIDIYNMNNKIFGKIMEVFGEKL